MSIIPQEIKQEIYANFQCLIAFFSFQLHPVTNLILQISWSMYRNIKYSFSTFLIIDLSNEGNKEILRIFFRKTWGTECFQWVDIKV